MQFSNVAIFGGTFNQGGTFNYLDYAGFECELQLGYNPFNTGTIRLTIH